MGVNILPIDKLINKLGPNGKPLGRIGVDGVSQIFCSYCDRYVNIEDSEYRGRSPRRRCKQCASAYVSELKKRLARGEPKRYRRRKERDGFFECCTCRQYKIKAVSGRPPRARCGECDVIRVKARHQRFKQLIESGANVLCHICGETKSGSGDNGFVHGRRGCKKCSTITKRMRTYGLTRPQAEEMTNQELCEICGDRFEGIRGQHIDHCHKTNAVRGVLCISCNLGIGYFKDDMGRLTLAIEYLMKHSSVNKGSNSLDGGA